MEKPMEERRATKVVATVQFALSAFYAAAGLGFCALVTFLYWPAPRERLPTLAGVTPAPLRATLPISRLEPDRGSYGLPVGCGETTSWIEGPNHSAVRVFSGPIAPGVRLATTADRLRAAKLEVRVSEDEVFEPVAVTVGG
jgi:hypothetical protein